jgi:valyl-tRNA synthetase
MLFVQHLIESLRNIRGEMGIPPSREIAVAVRLSPAKEATSVTRYDGYFKRMARVTSLTFLEGNDRPRLCASAVVDGEEIFVPLEGLIDVTVEKARLQKEIDRITALLKGIQSKLGNASFVEKAPKDVVEKEKEKLDNFGQTLKKLNHSLEILN